MPVRIRDEFQARAEGRKEVEIILLRVAYVIRFEAHTSSAEEILQGWSANSDLFSPHQSRG